MAYDNIKSHEKVGFHPLSRRHISGNTTVEGDGGRGIDPPSFLRVKFQNARNFELKSLLLWNYKNAQTGKSFVGISSNGQEILFWDIYPGSISDYKLTEIVYSVKKGHKTMTDWGFPIQELCSVRRITLNRPKQKYKAVQK